jgi:hypothetical protein
MSHQVGLSITARVVPERLEELVQVVATMAEDPASNSVVPFARIPHTHFGRVLILQTGAGGSGGDSDSPTLLMTLDCDASTSRRLRDLVAVAGPGIDRLFGACEDYPASPDQASRLAYLRAHLRKSQVFYAHAVGRTLTQVREEARLRRAIEELLDAEFDGLHALTPHEVREELRRFVAADPALSWALLPAPPPRLAWRLRETAHKVAVPALLLVTLPVGIAAAALWLLALRRHERLDRFPEVEPPAERLRALGDSEDFVVQNAFTSLAPIRPGRFWQLTSTLTELLGSYMARHVFTTGSLSGLTTVHFARFMRVGPDRQVLFTSYYDGSLESYNNDFVDQVAWVLNTVFGQQAGYPRTRWMIGEGARNERWFKNFIRGRQVPTQIWWSAYPDLAAVTIDQNARLRAGLSGELDAEELLAWLRIL